MRKPNCFYNIVHTKNLASILRKGICCRQNSLRILNWFSDHQDIADKDIIKIRKNKTTPAGKTLINYVNLYIQPRNAMLYQLICKLKLENLCVLQVSPVVADLDGVYVTDGNATSSETKFHDANAQGFAKLDDRLFQEKYWSPEDDSKRRMMAELLVLNQIPKKNILCVYVANDRAKKKVEDIVGNQLSISVMPKMFFQPDSVHRISNRLWLAKGDMFFSKKQTFTISVNTKGIMGKGLASRTKYQFPDAYVRYQDDCKSGKLKMGTPTLYKRYIKIEESLADNPNALEGMNSARWFLFFPTKNHWREAADLEGIETGLQWLLKHYEKEGIESIALPALGCGLGRLSWKDVGPMMCRYLVQMTIPSCIYLPTHKELKEDYLSPDFLLEKV